MLKTIARRLLPATLGAIATAVGAQPTPRAKPDPTDPSAGVPAVIFQSSLARYRGYAEQTAVSWREANDSVARIGGWRAYAREANQVDAPVSGPPAPSAAANAPPSRPPSQTPSQPQAGHGHHGSK